MTHVLESIYPGVLMLFMMMQLIRHDV